MHHELVALAQAVDGIDIDALDEALRSGSHRHAIFDDLETIRSGVVRMSQHLFFADGSDVTNPGLDVHWQGDWAKGFPVIDRDEPDIDAALFRTHTLGGDASDRRRPAPGTTAAPESPLRRPS